MDGVLNVIGGREVPARSGATLPNWEPATGGPLGTLPDSDATDVADAVEAARRAFPSLERHPGPGQEPPAPEGRRRAAAGAARARPRRVDGQRQAHLGGHRGGHPARDRELRASSPTAIHPALERDARRSNGRAQLHAAPPARRRGMHLALEPAALPADLEDRARARRRQHRRRQALRDHADDGASARAHRARGGAAAGRPQHRARARRRRSGDALSPAPGRPGHLLHRRHRAPAPRSPRSPPRASRSSRSSWAARTRPSSSPTPTSTTPIDDHRALAFSQPGPDLPLRLAHLRRGERLRPDSASDSSSACRTLRDGRPARCRRPSRGALSRSRTATRCCPTSRWPKRKADGSSAAAGGAKVDGRCRDGWFIEPTLVEGLASSVPHQPGRDLRPRRHADRPSTTRTRRSELRTTARYGLAATVWTRRPRPRPPGRRRASRPASCG